MYGVGSAANQSPLSPYSAKLDLTLFNFADGDVALLIGNWQFFWGQLLTPEDFRDEQPPQHTAIIELPSFWKELEADNHTFGSYGFATYRVIVTGNKPSQAPLSISISGVVSAYNLWVNGKLLSSDGKVSSQPDQEISGRHTVSLIPLPPLSANQNSYEIVLQISNHHHWSGGMYLPLKIGSEKTLEAELIRDRLFLAFFSTMLLLMGCYHLVLYFFRRKDPSPLYFGIYCLLWLIQSMACGAERWMPYYLFPDIPPLAVYYVDAIAYFFSTPMMLLFVRSLFPDETPSYLPKIYLGLASALTVFLLLKKQIYLDGFIIAHVVSSTYVIVGMVILVRAKIHQRQASGIILGGGILLALSGINDLLNTTRIIDTGYMAHYGLLIFICSQTCALALRFSSAHTTVENLSAELNEKNRNLQKVDKLKDEFLANTSHEIRTPLSGIIGLAESMLAGATGNLGLSTRHNLGMVVASGKRLSSMVNDLLDFSRLNHKELNLKIQPIDLPALIDTIIAIMTPMAKAKGLSLEQEMPKTLPPVLADEDRLQQIVYNLVGNAIRFTRKGSIVVSTSAHESEIEIHITDTGIGIPPEKYDDIFHYYEQVESDTARKFGGTGLGLAITRQLVELHGGQIRVESVIEHGSTFSFTLPRATEGVQSTTTYTQRMADYVSYQGEAEIELKVVSPPSDPEKLQSGISILVVDDDPINLQVATNHLITAGYYAETAPSGTLALEFIQSHTLPDLILLDIMMPGMTGYEVCQKLRKKYSSSILPIILLTAKNRVSDLVKGFEVGANDYLQKPFSREEFLSRINAQLSLKKAFITLKENVELKKDLQQRMEREQHLLLGQRRLSRLLDTSNEAILAVNESDEIIFCNQTSLDLFGYTQEHLLGNRVCMLFEKETAKQLGPMLATSLPDTSDIALQDATLLLSNNKHLTSQLMIAHLEFDDEHLRAILIRQQPHTTHATDLHALSSLKFITELNKNQLRIRALEEMLEVTQSATGEHSTRIQQDLITIDTALEDMSQSLLSPAEHEDRKHLAVKLLNVSIDYWREATGLDKFEMARKSGLWKVYTNKDGWERAQTLDKYLTITTLPNKPRWKLIVATADFVLTYCDTTSPLRDYLESTLVKLRYDCQDSTAIVN